MKTSQVDNVITKIEDYLQQISILNDDMDKLIRQRELGEILNFSNGRDIFQLLFDLVMPVKGVDLSHVPLETLKKFESKLSEILNNFTSILKFDPKNQNNSAHQRDQLIIGIGHRYNELFEIIQPILVYLLFYNNAIDLSNNKAKESLNEIEKIRTQIKETRDKMLEEATSTLESLRKVAGTSAITKFSEIFKEESKTNETDANKWKISVVVLLCVIPIVAFVIILIPFNHTDTFSVVQYSIARLLILTVLFYALNLCNKNYKSHKHNFIVNKHRQNSLNTFEAFVKTAGEDNQTKNAVLLEATRTIFSNQQSGYVPGDNESEMPTRIIELIKSSEGK